jgi:hypothetical protein
MKRPTLSFLAGFLSCAALIGIYLLVPSQRGSSSLAQLPGNSPHAPGSRLGGAEAGREKSTRTERDADHARAKAKQQTIARLGALVESSPALVDRLDLFLFDSEFKPRAEEWAMLGVPRESVEKLGKDLKNIFEDMQAKESNQFKVRRQTDNITELSLPALSKEEAEERKNQIEGSFASAVGSENSRVMSEIFLKSHAKMAAGLNGRDRVVSVRALGPGESGGTEDRYEFTTYIINEKNDLSKIEGDVGGYSTGSSVQRAATIPKAWSHLVEASGN